MIWYTLSCVLSVLPLFVSGQDCEGVCLSDSPWVCLQEFGDCDGTDVCCDDCPFKTQQECFENGGICKSFCPEDEFPVPGGCWDGNCTCCASCTPTPQCQAQNGHCVRDPSECDGFIDSCGCEGINCMCCVPEPARSIPSTCSGTTAMNDMYGIIQLGSAEELYANNLDCSWVLEPPPGNAVTLTWLRFDVEYQSSCVWDWIQIESAGVIGPKFCGEVIPTTTTYCGPVELYFRSDGSVQKPGFAVFYNIAPSICSAVQSTTESTVFPPRYFV